MPVLKSYLSGREMVVRPETIDRLISVISATPPEHAKTISELSFDLKIPKQVVSIVLECDDRALALAGQGRVAVSRRGARPNFYRRLKDRSRIRFTDQPYIPLPVPVMDGIENNNIAAEASSLTAIIHQLARASTLSPRKLEVLMRDASERISNLATSLDISERQNQVYEQQVALLNQENKTLKRERTTLRRQINSAPQISQITAAPNLPRKKTSRVLVSRTV